MTSPERSVPLGTDRRTLPRVADLLGLAVVTAAVLVLIGWALDIGVLKSVGPGLTTMKVNTALCLGALGVAVRLRPPSRTAIVLAALVGVVTGLTSVEFLVGVDTGIDELLVDDRDSPDPNQPGRMAPATLVSLVALAAAVTALQLGRTRVAQGVAAVPGAVAALAVLGYAFSVEELYGIVPYSTMALHTAVAIVFLSLAVAAMVPGGLLPWAALDQGVGATVVRRMVPVVMIGLPLVGLLALFGEDRGAFGSRFGHALMVAGVGVVLLLATLNMARQLDAMDAERQRANRELQELNEGLVRGRDEAWRKAEELGRSLEEERAAFVRAIGKVDDLIWTLEVLPGSRLALRFASPNAHGVLGGDLPVDDDVARLLLERVPEADLHLMQGFIDDLAQGRPSTVEFRLVGFDGVIRWIWARGAPRTESGRLFCDGIATNVTERHQLAEQREGLLLLEQEQVRQLREIDRLRDEFLAVTGHELRTPLTSIRGYAELLQTDAGLSEKQRDYVSVIVKRAHQLGQLVEDLFDLTRLSAGLTRVEQVPVDVFEAVSEAVDAHAQEAKEAGLTVNTSFEVGLMVMADPVRLRQVLDNLLANAVKYANDHGHIVVTTRRSDDSVLIEVADDGIGIPEEELEHVFERLYRGSTARERGIRGTGLGLAVCKALVEAHGGTISAARIAGGGTAFRVLLPIREHAEPTVKAV